MYYNWKYNCWDGKCCCGLMEVGGGYCVILTVSAMQKATVADNQTALRGTSRLSTKCHKPDNGMAPSRENAYTILEWSSRPILFR